MLISTSAQRVLAKKTPEGSRAREHKRKAMDEGTSESIFGGLPKEQPRSVANAVYHATGKRVRDLPITFDKLV